MMSEFAGSPRIGSQDGVHEVVAFWSACCEGHEELREVPPRHDQLYQALELSTVELEVLCLTQKHGQVLTAAGKQVRITAGPA
jgi:hypothetical protein